ncbi:MAG: Zn-dependent protease [Alphaproteobacteria bacterium]|nr:MAG: Zn-dependent protease [Alphaproteobacteria bacterium]
MHASAGQRDVLSATWTGTTLFAVLALVLAGCSSSLLTAGAPPGSLPEAPRQVQPQQQSPAPNSREHQRILAAYNGAYEDPKLEGLLNQVVASLVAASERPEVQYRVTILNSASINAFALPSGQLYVTRGLIALADDTSELASVLSHEMSHVIARHAAMREDQARQVALVSRVVQDVLSDPETGALALAKSKIALASFSRAQEFEADGIGIGIATRAGYDAYGAVRFLTSMGRNAELKSSPGQLHIDPRAPDFLSSHPATPERIKNAQANARQFNAPGAREHDKATYLAGIDGLVYGEDPSEGFVRGRRFLHPKLGFTFLAPEGFTLDNTAQAVLGVKESGGQALRLDVVRVPAEQPLAEYLNSGWIENIDPKSVEAVVINGLPAATATAKGDQWVFRLYAVRFGSDVYRFIFASKRTTAEIDRAFRESVGTFRRMTVAESQAAKPLHIRIVTVGPNDTVERLAGRMAIADRAVERFRVLNGLGPGERVSPGDQVKLVVE